jgi:hypothetical protein
MDHHRTSPARTGRPCAARLALVACIAAPLTAQTPCPGFGGLPQPARLEPAPIPLTCPAAPGWPTWHLWTPAHDAPGLHAGFRPGDASQRARLLVSYRCTGLWLVPVVPSRVRTMGYVIHQPETACGG